MKSCLYLLDVASSAFRVAENMFVSHWQVAALRGQMSTVLDTLASTLQDGANFFGNQRARRCIVAFRAKDIDEIEVKNTRGKRHGHTESDAQLYWQPKQCKSCWCCHRTKHLQEKPVKTESEVHAAVAGPGPAVQHALIFGNSGHAGITPSKQDMLLKRNNNPWLVWKCLESRFNLCDGIWMDLVSSFPFLLLNCSWITQLRALAGFYLRFD